MEPGPSAMLPGAHESPRRFFLRIFGLEVSASTVSWLLVAALLVVVSLNAAGIINLRLGGITASNLPSPSSGPTSSYVDAAEKLKGADQSQPLHAQLEGQFP